MACQPYHILSLFFYVDILNYLNQLNFQLQENGLLVYDLQSYIFAFELKLRSWESHLDNNLFHFLSLSSFSEDINIIDGLQFIGDLCSEFAYHFGDIKSYIPIFKIFSWPFDVDSEEVLLQLQMELIDFQSSKDLKSKFLTCHILIFYKNHMLLSKWLSTLVTHTQQVVSMFRIILSCEHLFSKMKHAKIILCSTTVNLLFDVLLLSISSPNPNITSFCDCEQYHMSH